MSCDVLLVEDEAELGSSIAEYLGLSGVRVRHVLDAESALAALEHDPAPVILLDINLPGMSGLQLCRQVRERSDAPIVFLSARGGDGDQVLALSMGGDDYLVKPFSLAVLLAKVRRRLARHDQAARDSGAYDDGRLRVDPAAGRVYVDGAEVTLKAMEFRLLAYLVAHRGRIVGKAELFDQVWDGAIAGDGTINVHLRRLRTKIEPDPAEPTYLRTVWGRGLVFEGRES